jgi:hypothetical protein
VTNTVNGDDLVSFGRLALTSDVDINCDMVCLSVNRPLSPASDIMSNIQFCLLFQMEARLSEVDAFLNTVNLKVSEFSLTSRNIAQIVKVLLGF